MNKNQKRIGWTVKLYASAVLIVALIAGSVSLASFAEMNQPESMFGVKAEGKRVRTSATPSLAEESLPSLLTAGYSDRKSLQELLEQETDNEKAIIPTWFQVSLNGIAIADSDHWNITLKENQKIKSSTAVKHQLKVTIYPQAYGLGDGNSVTWNLGRIEGLSLDSEYWEELVLSGGIHVGDVMLCYTENSNVILYTEFNEAVNRYSSITITYWYDCSFISVDEPTWIVFDLPGYDEPVPAVLLPENETTMETEETKETTTEESSPQETTEAEATTEESSPQETTEAEATTEESSPQETTEAEATTEESNPQETTETELTTEESSPQETLNPSKAYDSGGNSSSYIEKNILIKETAAIPETVPESLAATETSATGPQPEDSKTQEQNSRHTESAEAADETAWVLDINLPIGTEVATGHGIQSQALPNEILTYKMVFRNDGIDEIKDIRIRDYLPERTSFVSAGGEGVYGVADGQQYITWMLESILPGEEKELIFQVKVFLCTPPDFLVRNQVYWQADDSRSVNNLESPENQLDFPIVTIG